MAGIYIHIPFCRQACHYCDFHFSTSLKKKEEMIDALLHELLLRKEEVKEPVETIYFGGGTPSVLDQNQIEALLDCIYELFEVTGNPEITLEANPDDLSGERIRALAYSRINRLSIGIQSFYDDDLKMMNRAHNADEAWNCLKSAVEYFNNISIDLIYGIPGMSLEKWESNIQKALLLGIPHISSYALTVEPKTVLSKLISTGSMPAPDDAVAYDHFMKLAQILERNGFVHYELSNFGKPEFFSKNNSAYWLGKKYLGIGPSAHSFDGQNRSWNISNNALYIKTVRDGRLPSEIEALSVSDRYNEYVMTGLRTIWGISLEQVKQDFGEGYLSYLLGNADAFLNNGQLIIENNVLKTTLKGKFFCDGIASDLFMIN